MSLEPYKYKYKYRYKDKYTYKYNAFPLLAVVGCQTGEGRDYLGTADKYVQSFLSIIG